MSRDDLSDKQLMERILERDDRALEILFDRYAAIVKGLGMRILSDVAMAEDVAQETFWRVWTKGSSYREDRGEVSSWLFGIAHNLCIDQVRKTKSRRAIAAAMSKPHPVDETDEAAMRSLRRSQVRSALEELPSSQREVLELAYFGGLTRKEIASVTGEPLGTVHTRARLGLQKLRASLQEKELEIG